MLPIKILGKYNFMPMASMRFDQPEARPWNGALEIDERLQHDFLQRSAQRDLGQVHVQSTIQSLGELELGVVEDLDQGRVLAVVAWAGLPHGLDASVLQAFKH